MPPKRPAAKAQGTGKVAPAVAKARAEAAVATAQRTARTKPVAYSEAIVQPILDGIAAGESLRVICGRPGMPERKSVFRWLAKHPEFEKAYTLAYELQAEHHADEVGELIESVRTGRLDPKAAKVMLTGMQWMAEKRAPKKYGSSLNVKHGGAVGVVPLEMEGEQAARVARALLSGLGEGEEEKP